MNSNEIVPLTFSNLGIDFTVTPCTSMSQRTTTKSYCHRSRGRRLHLQRKSEKNIDWLAGRRIRLDSTLGRVTQWLTNSVPIQLQLMQPWG